MSLDLPETIDRKLERLPAAPGVYMFQDAKAKVIYVGKATSLRARVRSYFGKTDDGRLFFPWIVRQAADLEWIVTASGQEALILENNLIKQHKPKFNVKLTDDKTYLSIKLSTNEPFPRALLVRRAKKDGALYFGPYGSASAIRQTLRTIRKFFPLRTCTNAEFRQRTRPCIQHQMGRCGAPCTGLQDVAAYDNVVQETALFLRGRTGELVRKLEAKMTADAEALRFEAAARTRDQIGWIGKSQEKQRAVLSIVDTSDRDVFGEVREGDAVIVQAHFIREGKLVSTHGFTIRSELPTDEVLAQFAKQFYAAERYLPDEVIFPVAIEDAEELEALLSERKGRKVRIIVPERGDRLEWVEMARENARRAFRDETSRREAQQGALVDLKNRLGLANVPRRIECVDISSISGAFAVGSLVVMKDGELERAAYKRFKIRTVERADDFTALDEVLSRRFKRAPEIGVKTALAPTEDEKRKQDAARWRLPDLLLVDGGLPQLSVALKVFHARGIEGVDLATIAKLRREKEAGGRTAASLEGRKARKVVRAGGALGAERIFRPGSQEPVMLPDGSPAMHLLQRLRDEAHRFAIGYHKELRGAVSFKTGLEEVKGLGPKRRRALLEHFGSLRKLRAASIAEIAECPTISPTQAEAVHAFFQEGEGAAIPDEGRLREEDEEDLADDGEGLA